MKPQVQTDALDGGTPDLISNGDLGSTGPTFAQDIQADIDTLGCSASSCHGQSQAPVVTAHPTSAADIMTNRANFAADGMSGANSPILVKPLAGSAHAGGTFFQSTSDPIYQRWLAWINAGNP